jgi:hypothetical protein
MRTQLSKLSVVLGVIIAGIVFSVLCPQPTKAEAQVVKQKFNVPIDVTFHAVDFSCLTEDVHVFGINPTQTQTVIDAKGGFHLQIQERKDVAAVGLTTGDRYNINGPAVTLVYDFDTDPSNGLHEIFFHNIIHIVGPGRDGSMLLRELFHVVFNANGVQIVEVAKQEVVCQGTSSQ